MGGRATCQKPVFADVPEQAAQAPPPLLLPDASVPGFLLLPACLQVLAVRGAALLSMGLRTLDIRDRSLWGCMQISAGGQRGLPHPAEMVGGG